MNLPNKLTVLRLFLTVIFLAALFAAFPFHHTVALALFSVAALTDYWDGKIAREQKLITNFGILMDPLADKILICSAFIAFVDFGWVPAWMVIVIVARELAITGLRLLAASNQVVLAAEALGKYKTIAQIVAIVALMVLEAHGDWGLFGQLFSLELAGGGPWVGWFAPLAVWVSVVLTFLSGWQYLWRNREHYLQDR